MRGPFAWLAAALVGLAPSAALAVPTSSFVVDTEKTFSKGELDGTAALSDGKLVRALAVDQRAVEGPQVAYASAVGPDGAVYVGTGNEGVVFRVTPGGVTRFAETGAALVASLVWVQDTLYAGTLPEGKVLAISQAGKVRELAALEGAQHVWDLAFDPKQRTLYAATGPEGKLFALDLKGQARVLHDDSAEHLLSLGLDSEGRIYAGTSHGARLIQVSKGDVRVLYDAPGQEITALHVGKAYVAIAANEFPDPPPANQGTNKSGTGKVRKKGPKPGKGKAFTVGFDGSVAALYESTDAHISAIEIEPGGAAVQLGLAEEGHVVRAARSGETAVWADAGERQVVGLALYGAAPHFVTSDGVAVYFVKGQKAEGQWISEPLDGKVPARFGQLSFRKRGQVRWSTRSGNTEKPDATWSDWSSELTEPGPIRSAPARFLQIRAKLAEAAEVYAVEAFYLPQNRPAHAHAIEVKAKNGKEKEKDAAGSETLKLTWKVDNPDDDALRYRLFFRREGQAGWLPLLREHELLEKNQYEWDTRGMPDGFYRLRVEVSDERDNPAPLALTTHAVSAPIRVDNQPPEVVELRFQRGRLAGRVRDNLAPVRALSLSIDGSDYLPISPEDGLLDTPVEPFAVDLSDLTPGTHIVSVQATDAAGNLGAASLEISVKR